MLLRAFEKDDLDSILKLFYNTVHNICVNDYTYEQLNAWASSNPDKAVWLDALLNSTALVACDNKIITGFANLQANGYLDRLYVSCDYQKQGIACKLYQALEQVAQKQGVRKINTHASITAKPFFEKLGFLIIEKQTVVRQGISLDNFIMEKIINGE